MLSEINKIINKETQIDDVPGMALVVAQFGEKIYENFYGFRNVDKKLPVEKDTIFGVASITKSNCNGNNEIV